MLVFSAFSVGLFANAILPGRIGELARVAVLNRSMRQSGAWARLLGTVFAHRVFDLVAVIVLVVYVTLTTPIPSWAVTSLIAVVVVGVVLFTLAVLGARNDQYAGIEDGSVRCARWYGSRVTASASCGGRVRRARAALPAARLGLSAVRRLHGDARVRNPRGAPGRRPRARADERRDDLPSLARERRLVQAAVALPLFTYYGVDKARGIAFGFGLQAIEASVGISVGLIFLAREGLSVAMLRVMPDVGQAETPEEEPVADAERPRARVSG